MKKNLPKRNTSPAIKKVKSLASTPNISAQYNECQNDEIEEIIPVKTEPVENLNTHGSIIAAPTPTNDSQSVAANQNIALLENNDSSAFYGEDFGEYGDFSEAREGYEQGGMLDNSAGNTGERGDYVDYRYTKILCIAWMLNVVVANTNNLQI